MSLVNPTTVAFLIALLGLGLAAVAWGSDSRLLQVDARCPRREI